MSLQPGVLLADRYALDHRIAVGGMGEVWAATDRRLGRAVAVKVLKSEFTSDPEFVDRFRAEARITASLNNPGIAAVYDYGETALHDGGRKDTAYLVMELVTGEPLSAVLARTPRLPLPRLLDMLEQSGRALQEAHARGLVHRDIKPGNILITPAGKVKITDFGIAKAASHVPLTRQGMVMGTAQYLAPEQAAGGEAVAASDVYALGVVGYECLAGRRPFTGDNQVVVAMAQIREEPPPLPPDVPPAVATLVMSALVKDPAQRFPNGLAFAEAVAAVRQGAPVARPVPVVSRPAPAPVPPPIPGSGPGPMPPGGPAPLAGRPWPPGAPVVPGRRPRTALAVTLAVLVLLLAAAVLIISYRGDGGPLDITAGALLAGTLPGGFRSFSEPVRDLDLAMSAGPSRETDDPTDTHEDPASLPYRHRGMQ